ncbi:MAG: hemerythrin domain-containing protein [Phycisphaeraceae bacterium]
MPVSLNQSPDHGFDAPMGLLSDCHRRIERFLAAQLEVVRTGRGEPLDARQREALEKSLRYFKNAAPWHTADEEDSLFPRLRQSSDPQVQAALAQMDRLEADHRVADALHRETEQLLQRWLDDDRLPSDDVQRLLDRLETLQGMYREHIALEDNVLFPLATQVLPADQVNAMGREMAARRGVDADRPEPRCKHARQKREADAD